ncbi:hypothetical protein GJAV_G00242990 [Gymnothorax javanicus]|nr:hypothetical protein GJAV_G00242990 [Gymnothorax javanicus]
MGTSAFWTLVECACRILGVSTAAVLCAVGVETLRQGEFYSLGVYLLVSCGGMLVFELSFFTDAILMWCLPCPPEWKVFVLWKKLATLGGFQKFLYYTLMSVMCFLHPVLLWHAIIPGTMLLVTGFAYLILSKNEKSLTPKELTSAAELGCYADASTVMTCASDAGETVQTYSFLRVAPGNRTPALCFFPLSKGGTLTTLDAREAEGVLNASSGKREKRRVHFDDKATCAFSEETKMEEYQDTELEETTSDKAPMIRP